MPRQPRPHAPGVVHHLISKFVNREWRMQDAVDRESYTYRLERANRVASHARRLAITLAHDAFHVSGIELARQLGLSRATVSNVLRTARGTPLTDEMTRYLVERILERAAG